MYHAFYPPFNIVEVHTSLLDVTTLDINFKSLWFLWLLLPSQQHGVVVTRLLYDRSCLISLHTIAIVRVGVYVGCGKNVLIKKINDLDPHIYYEKHRFSFSYYFWSAWEMKIRVFKYVQFLKSQFVQLIVIIVHAFYCNGINGCQKSKWLSTLRVLHENKNEANKTLLYNR